MAPQHPLDTTSHEDVIKRMLYRFVGQQNQPYKHSSNEMDREYKRFRDFLGKKQLNLVRFNRRRENPEYFPSDTGKNAMKQEYGLHFVSELSAELFRRGLIFAARPYCLEELDDVEQEFEDYLAGEEFEDKTGYRDNAEQEPADINDTGNSSRNSEVDQDWYDLMAANNSNSEDELKEDVENSAAVREPERLYHGEQEFVGFSTIQESIGSVGQATKDTRERRRLQKLYQNYQVAWSSRPMKRGKAGALQRAKEYLAEILAQRHARALAVGRLSPVADQDTAVFTERNLDKVQKYLDNPRQEIHFLDKNVAQGSKYQPIDLSEDNDQMEPEPRDLLDKVAEAAFTPSAHLEVLDLTQSKHDHLKGPDPSMEAEYPVAAAERASGYGC